MYLYVPDTVAARHRACSWRCTTAPAAARPSTPAPSSRRWPTGTASSSSTRRRPAAASASTCPHRRRCAATAAATRWASSPWSTTSGSATRRPDRIFATGASSGAMMTNVLLGDYPDVFTAGAAFVGVPFGCFATTDGSEWNSACANGQVIKTPQQWGDLVRNAYPGYTGARPRMQVWHGTNDDDAALPQLRRRDQAVDQRPRAEPDARRSPTRPQSGWTRTRYGGTGGTAPVEAISMQGVGAQPAGRRQAAGDPLLRPGHRAPASRRPPRLRRPRRRRTTPPPTTPTADHAATAHDAAAGGRLPGRVHRQRLEHRAHHRRHHHQHRHHRDQRLDPGVHPARRADHHLRLERHLLARPAAR